MSKSEKYHLPQINGPQDITPEFRLKTENYILSLNSGTDVDIIKTDNSQIDISSILEDGVSRDRQTVAAIIIPHKDIIFDYYLGSPVKLDGHEFKSLSINNIDVLVKMSAPLFFAKQCL